MYCPNCGAYNEASYNNCTSCGKYIGDINKTQTEAAENEKKETQQSCAGGTEQKTGNFFSDYEKQSHSHAGGEASAPKTAFNAEQGDGLERRNFYTQYTRPPRDYFVFSIICTLLMSMTFGLAAVVFSVMTKIEISAGNLKRAEVYSLNVKRFCIVSIIIGIVKYLFIIFMSFVVWNSASAYRFYMW